MKPTWRRAVPLSLSFLLCLCSKVGAENCVLRGEHLAMYIVGDKNFALPEYIGDQKSGPPTAPSEDEIKRQHLQLITVEFIVTSAGETCGVKPHFDKKVNPKFVTDTVEAVRQWRFRPARKKGKPVPFPAEARFVWRPHDN